MATRQKLLELIVQTEGAGDVSTLAKSLYDVGQSSSVAADQTQAHLTRSEILAYAANFRRGRMQGRKSVSSGDGLHCIAERFEE